MSLKPVEDAEFVHDLTARKEYYSLKSDPDYNFKDPAGAGIDPYIGKYLKLQSHQLFVKNYFNPNLVRPGRLQLTHAPGMGKTPAACAAAAEFIRVYKKIYNNLLAKMPPGYRSQLEVAKLTPSIIVLGFGGTKAAFTRELLGHPEFGFISVAEKEELGRRRVASLSGYDTDVKHYKDYQMYLKKRVTNKSKDGFYKFYGYEEFVNKLFLGQGTKLTEIEADIAARARAGESITLESEVNRLINEGKIGVDRALLESLRGSLLICDEVHNTYNMYMKNNRGVAIQYVIDTVPLLWLLTMSATPINNSPTEITELVNYLSDTKVTKQELFANSRRLLPGALDKIVQLLRGKVSFLQDNNPKYFPERIFMGVDIPIAHAYESFAAGAAIPYLKFIPCKMSQYHQNTYETYARGRASGVVSATTTNAADFSLEHEGAAVIDTAEPAEPADVADATDAVTSHTISTDSYCLYDAAFPNPESDLTGLFKSSEIKSKVSLASQDWRDANMVGVKKYSATNSVLTGEFLMAKNVGKYWPKAAELLKILDKIVGKGEKVMIFHDRVRVPGVLAVQEMLRMNGYLDETSEPVDSTRCVHCGGRLADHNVVGGADAANFAIGGDDGGGVEPPTHTFAPARYITVHSEMEKQAMANSLVKYNAPENSTGANYMILIGSRIIKESYDFKDVQHQILMSLPTNIPTMLQVFGRCIRRNSHAGLPPEKRRVHIYILITTTADGAADPISPEMYRYMDKLLDYMVIQQIEKAINSHAVDVGLHWDVIMPPNLRAQYFPGGGTGSDPIASIGNLYFEPAEGVPTHTVADLNLTTFTAYKHFDDEIKIIRYLIKRLFLVQPVYTYDDMLAGVRRPPVGVEVNPALFDERNFIIALSGLVNNSTTILSNIKKSEMTDMAIVEKMMDPNDRYIYIRGAKYTIVQVGAFYMAVPVSEPAPNPLDIVHAEYTEHIRDKERAMINDLVAVNQIPIVDAESYLRAPAEASAGIRANLTQFIKESKDTSNYLVKRRDFLDGRYRNFLLDLPAQFQMSFAEEAIEHTIGGTAVDLHKMVLDTLAEFGAVVTVGEIEKYRDVVKLFAGGVPAGEKTAVIGYLRAKSVRIYDAAESKWLEVGRVALNRHVTYKENDIIVGYLDSGADTMKFKLRKPVQRLRADLAANAASRSETGAASVRVGVGDIRIVERGAVCSTKSKRDLLKIAGSIGLSVRDLDGEKVHNLCGRIFDRLVELEKKERARDSMYKYLYSWWDEPVNVVGGLRI